MDARSSTRPTMARRLASDNRSNSPSVFVSEKQSRSQPPRHSWPSRRPRVHPRVRSRRPPSENRSPWASQTRPCNRYARQSDSLAPERQISAPPAQSAADVTAAPVPSPPSSTAPAQLELQDRFILQPRPG